MQGCCLGGRVADVDGPGVGIVVVFLGVAGAVVEGDFEGGEVEVGVGVHGETRG